MSNPLVSIIIPTYNVEDFVEECLESVINQTYNNIEIIVIDDASTDQTPRILKNYESKINLELNSQNRGQGFIRNKGIEKSKGDYVFFVDSDDWIEQNSVEMLTNEVKINNVDVIRFNGISFTSSEEQLFSQAQYDFSRNLENKIYNNKELLKVTSKNYSASPCLYLVKRKLLIEKKILFPEGIIHEDEVFTTLIFLNAESMTYLNLTLYHRRYRNFSTMTNITKKHKEKSFNSYFIVYNILEKHFNSQHYDYFQKVFLKKQMISILNGLYRLSQSQMDIDKINRLSSLTIIDRWVLKLRQLKYKLKKA